jgi:hypothetical protein
MGVWAAFPSGPANPGRSRGRRVSRSRPFPGPAVPLALTLKPPHDAAGVDAVMVSTYQAVSGAGFGGEAWR